MNRDHAYEEARKIVAQTERAFDGAFSHIVKDVSNTFRFAKESGRVISGDHV